MLVVGVSSFCEAGFLDKVTGGITKVTQSIAELGNSEAQKSEFIANHKLHPACYQSYEGEDFHEYLQWCLRPVLYATDFKNYNFKDIEKGWVYCMESIEERVPNQKKNNYFMIRVQRALDADLNHGIKNYFDQLDKEEKSLFTCIDEKIHRNIIKKTRNQIICEYKIESSPEYNFLNEHHLLITEIKGNRIANKQYHNYKRNLSPKEIEKIIGEFNEIDITRY